MNLLIITQKVDQDDQLLGFFIDWLKEFAGRFEKVTVLCLEKRKFDLPENVHVFSLGKDRGASKLYQFFNFYKYCFSLRREYDAVFVHMNPIWVILGSPLWTAWGKKVYLWYAHKQVTTKLRLAEKMADGIFTSTAEGFRLLSKKLNIVGQGIDIQVFHPDLSKRREGINILSVGRIAPSKNYEVLIEAAKMLKDDGFDFRVTIIGEPALPQDKVYEKKIRDKIKNYGLEKQFQFLGKIPHRQLPGYYQSYQICVNTSVTGSLDKTILEAMASGCVVISSNDAAKQFLPQDLILESNDPIQLAEKIKTSSQRELRQELVDYARRHHSLDGLIDRISGVITEPMLQNILITGYPYIRENYLNTFNSYHGEGKISFLLPRIWKIKKGKVVYHPPKRGNVFTTPAYFHHSDYPIIGGLLKGWLPAFPYKLWQLRRAKNISLVYDSGEPILLSTLYNAFWSKVFGLKYVVFSWENIPFHHKFHGLSRVVHSLILKLNLFLADGVVCGNSKCRDIFAELTSKPLTVIPLSGLDEAFYRPLNDRSLLDEYNIRDKIVFTFIGAISYRKGIHLIVEAFGKVLDQVPKAHLIIAGSGEYEENIKLKIENLKLGNNITRIPWLSQQSVMRLLSASDVFVYPSISHGGWEEQFGYSMAEASLCELPIIATRSGSIEEIVIDGQTGILVAENNAKELGVAMLKLAHNKELRNKLGQSGREHIVKNFSNKAVVGNYAEFFEQCGTNRSATKSLVYVTNVRLPTERAHGLQIMKSCEAFALNGISVRLIVPNLRPSYNEDPFSYYAIKHQFPLKKIFILEVLPLAKFFGSWLGYVQNLSFSLSAILYLVLKRTKRENSIIYSRDYMTLWWLCFLRFRPVAELHDYRSVRPKHRIAFILRKASKLILNSQGTLDALRRHYPVDLDKVLIAPNGVDIDFFDIDQTKEDARRELGIPQDKTIVSYIGRLETVGREKGLYDLLSTFSRIYQDNMHVILYVVGGPQNMIQKYQKEAESLDIPKERVIFTGQVAYKNIPLYMRAVDIVVIPLPGGDQHSSTTSPIKLFEFMAAGKVMVVSDLSVLRGYLSEDSAVFFEPGDSEDLAQKLTKVLADVNLVEQLSKKAKELARKHTWLNRAKNIINFIND